MVRTLSIGTQVNGLTKCARWDEDININDYNIAFLNLHALDIAVGDDSISETSKAGTEALPSSEAVGEHMSAGNTLIIILPTRYYISLNSVTQQSLFNWSPMDLNLSFEEGSGIKRDSVSEKWSWYFDRPTFPWHLFIENKRDMNNLVQYQIEPIVENTYHKAVAGRICFGHFDISTYSGDIVSQRWLPGKIIYLPYLQEWAYQDIIKDTLHYVFESATEPRPENAPEWSNEYTVPGEQEVSEAVDDLQEQIDYLESDLSEQENELEEIREVKGLLYGGNNFLERLVPRVFREMEFEVEGEISGNRDGLIDTGSHKIILETHGTSGGIKKSKCRQLNDWVSEYQYDNPEPDSFGILVVNPFNNTPPTERDKPYNNNALKYVERCENKILLTTDLFEMYVQYQNGEIDQSDVRDALTSDEIVINHYEGDS